MRKDGRVKVLFAASELAPYVKTGALADTASALPAALTGLGVDVRLLVPGYPQVIDAMKSRGRAATLPSLPGMPPVQLLASKHPTGVQLLVVASDLYDRPGGPYQDAAGQEWPDNALRFALLSYVAALLSTGASPFPWVPDVLHCNDWQTGLAPAYLRYVDSARAKTVMTAHHLAEQGLFGAQYTARVGLPVEAMSADAVEFSGQLGFLKAGIQFADRITSVSPTYAKEIQSAPLGMGLESLLLQRSEVVSGILNGIDTDTWDPDNDPYIDRYYNLGRLAHKEDNRRALRTRLGLPDRPDAPLFAMVGRLLDRKGVDVLADVIPQLVEMPAQLVVLGSGEAQHEARFTALSKSFPDRVSVKIGYDETLMHQIEAGADIAVIPSRYEPCGVNQMYSQRYGTPPVVHATGGLKDSVIDATPAALSAKTATGFAFSPLTGDNLLEACRRAADLYRNRRGWRQLQKNGMAVDFSWERTAEQYLRLYRGLLG
ncbi:MAG: glycogen synthase GlgA [Burkholderiales bacterium]|nr:glycogen synthase GlgA [Burkholderiales bacterium]